MNKKNGDHIQVVPEDPVSCVLEQFGCEDVCERCYRRCTVRAPIKKTQTDIDQQRLSRKPCSSYTNTLYNALYFF